MTVPLADLTVDEVTGIGNRIANRIATLAADRANVDFSYSVELNALSRAMLAWAASRHFCGIDYAARWKGLQPGTATFTKYDERWTRSGCIDTRRLQSVQHGLRDAVVARMQFLIIGASVIFFIGMPGGDGRSVRANTPPAVRFANRSPRCWEPAAAAREDGGRVTNGTIRPGLTCN